MKRLVTCFALSLVFLSGCSHRDGADSAPIQLGSSEKDPGSLLSSIEDSTIETQAGVDIAKADPALANEARVVIVSYNGIVLLTGQVPHADLKPIAVKAANGVEKVQQVHDELEVRQPISLLARNHDTWLTTKVKSKMLADAEVLASRIKIVTENGTVYMMGMVSRSQGDEAVRVARTVTGVQKIVKLFEYTD